MLVFMAVAHRGPLHNHPLLTAVERRDIWLRCRPRMAPRDSILLQTRHRATSVLLFLVMARWPESEPPISASVAGPIFATKPHTFFGLVAKQTTTPPTMCSPCPPPALLTTKPLFI